MSIGQLPRLAQLTLGGIREWSDQFAQRLEFLFASPRQIGLAEIIQFQATAANPGFFTIPTPVGDIIVQWGGDTIDPPPPGAPSAAALAFTSEAPVVTATSPMVCQPDAGALHIGLLGPPNVFANGNYSFTPATQALALTGVVPVVSATGTDVTLNAGHAAVVGGAPVITILPVAPGGTRAVVFPMPFPGSAFVAFAIGNGVNAFPYSVSGLSTTGFVANTANGGISDNFYWLAIGN